MNDRALAFLFTLALWSISPSVKASGMEVCNLAGVVTAVTSADSEATYFRLSVEVSRPVSCLGWSSYEPDACVGYTNQELQVGLSTSEAPALATGDRVELVQAVVDITAGSEAGSQQVNWRSMRECEN
jgi:hypothetical protein